MRLETSKLVLLVLLAEAATAQDRWILAKPTTELPGRGSTAIAYDSHREVVVLYGGQARSILSDTWEWNGSGWARRLPRGQPPGLHGHAMAYDSGRRVTVLFGGSSNNRSTWEYDGSEWRRREAISPGSPRRQLAMAYDEVNRQIVRFGGESGDAQGQTWTWNGITWTLVNVANPPARMGHSMVWDAIHRRIVMYGGQPASGHIADNRTWEWDGRSWTPRSTARRPTAHAAMAYHRQVARTIMPSTRLGPNTWGYNGTNWHLQQPTGQPKETGPVAYDEKRNEVVMVTNSNPLSTYNKLYRYTAPLHTPGATRSFGTGCGAANPPALRFDRPAYLGYPVSLELTNLPNLLLAFPLLYLGSNDQKWGGLDLPWDMSVTGAPGCWLYTDPLLAVPATRQGTRAVFEARIPFQVGLIGMTAFAQGFVLDLSANALGLRISNAAGCKIGRRW